MRAAAALAGPLDGARVVDLAAGTGALAAALRERAGPPPAALTAVDAAPRMLARAGARLGPEVTLLAGDARAVALPDAAADLVTIGYLLHLLAPVDRDAVLAETRRLLRPGGRMVAVVHGSPPGAAGRAYRGAWRGLRRALPDAVIGEGPMADLAPHVERAGFVVDASHRLVGAYWSQVVSARRPPAQRWRA